tara:strand:- start:59686 stop:60105 length:420 start_codon:yes stop_codon:yes gene_type:complete
LLSTLIHLLTLLAFNVHALAGCCLHHEHAMGNCGHESMDCHASLVQDGEHSAEHDEAAHQESVPANDHSQPCDEGRCVYVDARIASPHFDLQPIAILTCGPAKRLVPHLYTSAVHSLSAEAAWCVTAGARCALLQSWQI